MNRRYDDLLGMTKNKPSFFQKNGVPRWETFDPARSTGVYAKEVAILEASCQLCDARFHVLVENDGHSNNAPLRILATGGSYRRYDADRDTQIRPQSLAYGDPPNVGCCDAGPTMTSETVRVVEFWTRPSFGEWERDRELEVEYHRMGGPWDREMIEKARAFLKDNPDEDIDGMIRSAMEDAEARIDEEAPTAAEPVRYTQYRSTSD